jgi:sporulation protein YlmC with PRC-barrel domain
MTKYGTFENRNLKNYTGLVLCDKDSIVKVYASKAMAEKTALKINASVVKNVKKYIIIKEF